MNLLRGKKVHITVILLLVFSLSMIHIVQAVTAEPGTDADPIVSKSYVDAKIAELAAAVNSLKQQPQDGQTAKFEVLEGIEPGKRIIGGASTEIILRAGKAIAVASENGGISDLTAGTDIQMGGPIPANHLMLVPRDDGRGIKVTEKAWVLVKGSYTIK